MQFLFECKNQISPKLSIVLLDWSCRDSFHVIDYLNNQTLPRKFCELIWIEYYNRRPVEIETKLKECAKSGSPGAIDKWIVMDMPNNIYYHKHLMYNVGILASRGEIICFCDSDAIVNPTFTENIVKAFEKNRNIVLHMDEVRNTSRKFYPFDYPEIEEIVVEGCINLKNGKTKGLLDKEDVLHTRNYGACMCALRQDLINIGGSDQHISYLGHVCGPYELTFRLVNAGRKELWHEEEFLYHTWHPGTNGWNNYYGPNDGMNMSTTALEIMASGRILPLVENPAIKLLRSKKEKFSQDNLLTEAVLQSEISQWHMNRIKILYCGFRHLSRRCVRKFYKLFIAPVLAVLKYIFDGVWVKSLLLANIFWMSIKQLFYKSTNYSENKVMPKGLFFKFQLVFIFFWRMWKNNNYAAGVCKKITENISKAGIKEISFYGASDVAKILFIFTKKARIKVINIFDSSLAGKNYMGHNVLSPESLENYNGKILIASFAGIKGKVEKLKNSGIQENNIIKLQ